MIKVRCKMTKMGIPKRVLGMCDRNTIGSTAYVTV